MVKVTISYNSDRITSAVVALQGIPGENCLLLTPEMRRLNPDAKITPTEEFEDQPESQIRLLEMD